MIRKIKLRSIPLFLLLLFAEISVFSQEFKIIEGQIFSDSIAPAYIHVVNLDREIGTTSDENGLFNIYANTGDRLLLSSIQFENREVYIGQEDFDSGQIKIELFPARNELDEVQISDLKLSGHLDTDLPKIKFFDRTEYGIPYPEKKLSQTERRLYTANQGITSRWQYIGVLLGGVSLDVILNDINGKTKYLKKLDKQDKLQILVKHGIDILGKSFFLDELKLPEAEIINFVYYCAREPEFQNLIQHENKLEIIEYYHSKKEDFINLRKLNDTSKN